MPALSSSDIYSLVSSNHLIPEDDLSEAQKTANHLNIPFYDVLIGKKLVSRDKMGELMAQAMGVAYVDLTKTIITKDNLDTIGEDLALERKIIPFFREGNSLHLAMEDPKDLETINYIRKITGLTVIPFFSFEKEIKFGLHQYKSTLSENFQKLLTQVSNRREVSSLRELAEDVSVIEAVKQMLEWTSGLIHVLTASGRCHISPSGMRNIRILVWW